MRKKGYFIWGCILVTYCLVGCSFSSKDSYLNEFSNFVHEIENNYKQYTDEDWEQKETRYQQYIGEKYQRFKQKLSAADHEQIGKLKGKYQTVKIKYQAEKIIDKASNTIQELKGIVEGVIESIEN